jgi:hypothetical protein
MHILTKETEEIKFMEKHFRNNLLKNATNAMNVTQSPMRPIADKQQRQVIAPPKPPNIPPSAPPRRTG